jgi:hypothetical protein
MSLTSSKLTVAKKSLWRLSPEPVQMYPIFLGLMLDAVKGGLSSGGVGSWRMGRGGALEAKGSVTPGIDGIRGGRLIPRGLLLTASDDVAGLAATKATKCPKRTAASVVDRMVQGIRGISKDTRKEN